MYACQLTPENHITSDGSSTKDSQPWPTLLNDSLRSLVISASIPVLTYFRLIAFFSFFFLLVYPRTSQFFSFLSEWLSREEKGAQWATLEFSEVCVAQIMIFFSALSDKLNLYLSEVNELPWKLVKFKSDTSFELLNFSLSFLQLGKM